LEDFEETLDGGMERRTVLGNWLDYSVLTRHWQVLRAECWIKMELGFNFKGLEGQEGVEQVLIVIEASELVELALIGH
jgi:hypothetical protein